MALLRLLVYLRALTAALILVIFAQMLSAQSNTNPCTEDTVSVPSRPTFIAPTDTTHCGVMEAGYGWTGQRLPNGEFGNVVNGTFRWGLLKNLDLRWGADQLSTFTSGSAVQAGIGDSYLGSTYRFREQSPKAPSLAVNYTAKLPTASVHKGLGTGETDHSVTFIASKDLGRYHLDFNAIEVFAGRIGRSGFDRSTILGPAISTAIGNRWVVYAESYGGTELNNFASAFATGFIAASYKASPRLVFDAGLGFGFTQGTPKQRIQIGVTYALGHFYSLRRGAHAKTSPQRY